MLTNGIQQSHEVNPCRSAFVQRGFKAAHRKTELLTTAVAAGRLGKSAEAFRKWRRRHCVAALGCGRYVDWFDVMAALEREAR